jgi:lysophospholipase L1-like esterase
MKKKILLFLFSTFISLISAELILRFILPPVLQGAGTDQTEKAALYGWAMPPGKVFQFIDPDSGAKSFFKINSQGWKDVEHSFAKPSGTLRILFLGDSNTFGLVPLKDLYTRKVEELLRKKNNRAVEVISMGLAGWGTDHALEALTNEGLRYKPDLVIYQFCGNDVTDNTFPRADTARGSIQWKKPFHYKIANGVLVRESITPQKSNDSDKLKRLLRKSALYYHAERLFSNSSTLETSRPPENKTKDNNQWWNQFPVNPQDPYFIYDAGEHTNQLKEAWLLMEKLLIEMKKKCAANNATFIVFSEESDEGKREWSLLKNRISNDGHKDYVLWNGKRYPADWRRPLKDLQKVCDQAGIPLITPKQKYPRYLNDPHPNADGNQAMAEDIVEYLINSNKLFQLDPSLR